MIISQTPVRISFFGGGSDFPEYFSQFGGAVLSTTIDKYCYLAVSYLSNFFDYRIKVSYSRTELAAALEEIEHPAARECLRHTGIKSQIELNYFSDLPARTGLGTSSSFVVGLLNSLYAYRGERVSSRRLAREAVYVERDLIKENVGFQDQYAAALGGFNSLEFKGGDEVRVEKVICPPERIRELSRNLLLFYTGIQRYSSEIQSKHISSIKHNQAVLGRMKEMAAAGRDILSGKSSLPGFGSLLDQAWQEKKSLGTGVSSEQIDSIYRAARAAGALGGKLLGAGGGGFLLFYVEPDRQEEVRRALSPLLEVPFQFENYGSQIIFYDPDKLGHPGRENPK